MFIGEPMMASAPRHHKSSTVVSQVDVSGKIFGGLLGFTGDELTHWIELDFGTTNFTLDIFKDRYEGTFKTKGNVVTLTKNIGGVFGKLNFKIHGKILEANMNLGKLDLWIIEWPAKLKKIEAPAEEVVNLLVNNGVYTCIRVLDSEEGKQGIKGTVRFTKEKAYWDFPNSMMDSKYEKEVNYTVSGAEIKFADEIGIVYNDGNFIEIDNGEGWFRKIGKVKTKTYLIK